MLKLNESKEWFHNYSKAGREAVKFNKVLSEAIKKATYKPKKKKYVNPCPEIAAFEYLEKKKEENDKLMNDDLDIFEKPVEEKEKENVKEDTDDEVMDEKALNKEKYKYHDKHMKNLKKKEEQFNPSCTKYNPNYDSIKTTRSIPSFDKLVGRKPPQKKEICDKFYIEHENIINTMAGNVFIDMSKQLVKQSIYDIPDKEKDKEKIFLYDNNNYSIINLNNTNNIDISNYINDYSKRNNDAFNKEMTKSSSRISNQRMNDMFDYNNKKYISLNNNSSSSRIKSANRRILKKIYEKKYKKEKNNVNISNISEIKPDSDFNENFNANDISNSINISLSKSKIKKVKTPFNNNYPINNSTNTILSSHDNSIDIFNNYYQKRMKHKKPKNTRLNLFGKRLNSSQRLKPHIKAPDFSKSLSRETIENIGNKTHTAIPYLAPSYTQVRERSIMMVSYNKRHKVKKLTSKSADIKGINYSFYFDADKCFDKINNHSTIHVPDFRLMSSRPIDEDPLPSYMKKIVDRNGLCEYSLNMNNYSNRDFGNIKTTFFPKKSFNKIINLNLLRSKKFFGNIIFGETRKKFKKTNPLIEKIIRFYSKNYENILKEKNLNKFDSITYKKHDEPRRKNIYK